MVLGKLPVPGRPTSLDFGRAGAYYACSGCGLGLFGHFFSHLSSLTSFLLSLGDTKQTTNQSDKSYLPWMCICKPQILENVKFYVQFFFHHL